MSIIVWYGDWFAPQAMQSKKSHKIIIEFLFFEPLSLSCAETMNKLTRLAEYMCRLI